MKILFYNIAYSTGMNGSIKRYLNTMWRFFWISGKVIKKIAKTLKEADPDVICLVEVDSGSYRNRFRCQTKALSKKLGYPFSESENKYHPKSIWRWMTLIGSQHDAVISKRHGKITAHYFSKGIQRLLTEFEVDGISIFIVHLPVLRKKMRKKHLSELAEIVKNSKNPYIVCGDFNIQTGYKELEDFIEKTGVELIETPMTFPSIKPSRTLDVFLIGPSLKVKEANVINVEHSDHLPIWIELDTDKKIKS